jgi:hypothetical protein
MDFKEIRKVGNLIELMESHLELRGFHITGVENLGSVTKKLYS